MEYMELSNYMAQIRRKSKQIEIGFFKSAMAEDSEKNSLQDILRWLQIKYEEIKVSVEQIPLNELKLWRFDEQSGSLVHASGKFFSIEGIRVETNWGQVPKWEQPIINQPEIGFLGIITKKIDGLLHLLLQAKIEPGNLNTVQLSPTLQATKSNYTKVHQGKSPLFLEFFNGEKNVTVLLDQLQSEQGGRFLRKRNRNIIIEIDESELEQIPDNFIWITLGQLKELIKVDNIVNMDTRTVVSCIPYGSYDTATLSFFSALKTFEHSNDKLLHSLLNNELYLNDFDQIISWFTRLKSKYDLKVTGIPLNRVESWLNDGVTIHHKEKKYFSIIGVNVQIDNREVVAWDQPMILPSQQGMIAFIVKPIQGIYHFLVQAKLEAGNFDILELAPTVQCLTGNYRSGLNEYSVPFLHEVLTAPENRIWYSALQSEEGGRFYKEQNRNMIIEVGSEFPVQVPENYCWMTLNQMITLIKFNNYLNIAARSLISAVAFS